MDRWGRSVNATLKLFPLLTPTLNNCKRIGYLEEIGVTERRAQREDVLPLGVLRHRLRHTGFYHWKQEQKTACTSWRHEITFSMTSLINRPIAWRHTVMSFSYTVLLKFYSFSYHIQLIDVLLKEFHNPEMTQFHHVIQDEPRLMVIRVRSVDQSGDF